MTVRTLVLMRHGKSGYPPGVWDHDRPLADRGIRPPGREWMSDDGLNVDMTLCSTATRTRQTLMRTGVDAPTIFIDDIYGGSPFRDPRRSASTFPTTRQRCWSSATSRVCRPPHRPSTPTATSTGSRRRHTRSSTCPCPGPGSVWSRAAALYAPCAFPVVNRFPRAR